MEQTKYDVFISYSRKDYVDDIGNVLPNNILSKIRDAFKANGITYWFDEEGIYSGEEFASIITKAIRNSKIFLFIASANSNKSKWTSNEISTALVFKKIIIPFRIDESPYNDSVMMKIVSFDYIECKNEEKAMNKLIKAVKHHLLALNNQQKTNIIDVTEGEKDAAIISDFDVNSQKEALSSKKGYEEQLSEKFSIKKWKSLLWPIIVVITSVVICIIIVYCNPDSEHASSESPVVSYTDKEEGKVQPVDLGLPSGTIWADRNVGAKSPTEFGDLYAWGEIETKEDYSLYTYVEQLKPSTKITSEKHDVAMARLGGEWMMPTEAQFRELISECKWFWKTVDGIKVYEIVGKNGNKIYFPAAGWSHDTTIEYRNKYGYYWTSERSSSSQYARSLQFPKDGKGIVGNGYLYYGRSVRAVCQPMAIAE